MECFCFCEMSKTSWQMGRHLVRGDSEDDSKVGLYRLVHRLNIILFFAKEQSRLQQFGKKVLLGICLGYVLIAGRNLERRCFGCRHRGAANFWTRQKSMLEGSMRKKCWSPKGVNIFFFPIADGTAKLSGRDFEVRESTPRREQPVRSEDVREEPQGTSERSQPTEAKDDAGARNDF